jgi:hypothetical protein
MTRDHVFPKSLFLTKDAVMITVASCKPCQKLKQKGDDYLREFVNTEFAGSEHPDALEHLQRIARAASRNQTDFGRRFIEGFDDELIEDGVNHGPIYRVPMGDVRPLQTTLRLIIRGLHNVDTGSILPQDTPIEAEYIHPLRRARLFERFLRFPPTNFQLKGNNIAGWVAFRPLEAKSDSAVYILEFNGAVTFLCPTGSFAEKWRIWRESG